MVIIYTIISIFFVLSIYTIYSYIRFSKAIKAVGLRIPKKWDGYEKKGEEQFRQECFKYSIRIDSHNMPNICYLISALEMKNLHLELVKDGHEEYNNQKESYLGSEEWIENWRKIIFSPTITSLDFCQCIKIIMKAHHFSEFDNIILPYVKGLDGVIKEKDSFFIFRALYIMHYNIRIRENSSVLNKHMVSNALSLKDRYLKKQAAINPIIDTYRILKLSEITKIHVGVDVREGELSLENRHRGLIYLRNINNGRSTVFYNSVYCISDNNIANYGYIVMGKILPYSIAKWKEEGSVLTEEVVALQLLDEEVVCDYLLLFLELIIEKIKREEKVKLEFHEIQNIKIAIPPRVIQKSIIKESLFIKHDVEKMKVMLSAFNRQLTEVISENTFTEQSLLDNNIETISPLESSSAFYDGCYKTEWVNGYYRKDGAYVQGHYRNQRK